MSQAKKGIADILRDALALLGPKGKNWVNYGPETEGTHCSMTALGVAGIGSFEAHIEALDIFREVIGSGDIAAWNDSRRSFAAIDRAFRQAMKKAERKASEVPHE